MSPSPTLLLLLPCIVSAVASGFRALANPLDTIPLGLRSRLAAHPAVTAFASSESRTPVESNFSPGVRVSPLDYGGDPTGVRDSSDALASCISACVNYSITLDALGHFPGDSSFGNGHYIANAGGCSIDLGGGEYLLSKPLLFPEYIGNMVFGHGSLVADDTPGVFPSDGFLIVVGIQGSCKVPQGSCNVDLGFPELFLNGRHVASGMQINNVMGTTIGPSNYFLNFTNYGLQINAGHEVLVDRCWLGETNFDYPFSVTDLPKSIAIQVNGNDHYLLNTIVFSSKIGVEINGAADVVTGVHVWFPMNQALRFVAEGIMAFHINEGGNRFTGCYIDGSRAVFEGSGLAHNVWTGGFECCAGGGLESVPHGIELHGDTIGPGLVITQNIFQGGSIFVTPLTPTKVPQLTGSRVDTNTFRGKGAGSRVTKTMTSPTPNALWTFDFCDVLLVPQIVHILSVSVFDVPNGYTVNTPIGCMVNVTLNGGGLATSVTLSVDSSSPNPDLI